jgi:hypothetical protein
VQQLHDKYPDVLAEMAYDSLHWYEKEK